MGKLMHNTQIKHSSHPHLLQLSSTVYLQNQLPANCAAGCNLHITSSDDHVYTCAPCGFLLHQSCSKFPQLITHPSHHEHALSLLPTPIYPGGFFRCDACTQHGTKFSYHCHFCDYDLHVVCASKPLSANHPFHPHPLVLTFSSPYGEKLGFSCDVCHSVGSSDQWLYRCVSCEFDVHLHCASVKVHPQPQPPLHHNNSFPGAAQSLSTNHNFMAAAGQPLAHNSGNVQTNYWQPIQNPPPPGPSNFQAQPPPQSNYNMPTSQTSGGGPPAMTNNQNQNQNGVAPAGNNGLGDVMVTGFVDGMMQQLGQNFVQSLTGGGGDNDGGNNNTNNYECTSTNDDY